MRIAVVLLLLFPLFASAQPLGVGLKAGIPFTSAVDVASNQQTLEQQHWTVGPYATLRLPFRLSVEANVLYNRFTASDARNVGGSTFLSQINGNSWEVPVLGKYRFHSGVVSPFIGAGPAFRRVSADATSTCTGSLCGSGNTSGAGTAWQKGFAVGAGIEFALGPLHVNPEIRYTRWSGDRPITLGNFSSNLNQALFLVGIGF